MTFVKTSKSFRKVILTGITLIVTVLLVASPILFLISAVPFPNQQRDECNLQNECNFNYISIPECSDDVCKNTASIISSKINWTSNVCNDFKSFCCSDLPDISQSFKTPQEIVDYQMLELLKVNATKGPFRKLGRLYDSCLKIDLNSSTLRYVIENLGGFLPPHLVHYSLTPLLTKIVKKFGAPIPLFDLYYDLSYGQRPQILMIIDVSMDANKIIQVN